MSRDAEALVNQALRAQPTVTAWSGLRISTSLKEFPCVRLTLVGGPRPPVQRTASPIVQWAAWGDTEASAAILAVAIAEVADQLAGTYSAGVIVSSWSIGHHFSSRDPVTSRPRYIGQIGLLVQ